MLKNNYKFIDKKWLQYSNNIYNLKIYIIIILSNLMNSKILTNYLKTRKNLMNLETRIILKKYKLMKINIIIMNKLMILYL